MGPFLDIKYAERGEEERKENGRRVKRDRKERERRVKE